MTAIASAPRIFSILLFGAPQVSIAGHLPVILRSRKAVALLALLALRHGRLVEREWLASTLWPDAQNASANLRPVLSALRRALRDQAYRLQSPNRHTLLLDLTGAEVDVLIFDAAIASKQLMALEQAVALYRGPLLVDLQEEWIAQERTSREQACLHALETLSANALVAGKYDAAANYCRQALGIDAWSEVARRGLMETLAKSGNINEALQVYREFVELLKSDPRAVPNQETSALYLRLREQVRQRASRLIGNGLAAEKPASPAMIRGNLPSPPTSLIGREDERLEVATRLRQSRLVTLTGPGGIGKTRLALAVAEEAIGDFGDGVWFVALENLTNKVLLAQQIAIQFGLKEDTHRTCLDIVTDHIREKRLVLVLDNCEHLLDESVQVVGHLLRECAEVRILATSREMLGITGETVWMVPALPVPKPSDAPQERATLVEVLLDYASVQLFVERAQSVQQKFSLSEANGLIVAQVCFQLEGIPLAIELAAARVRSMSVEQILVRLENYLNLPTDGSRAAQSRQQTLQATMDWSYSLLTKPEQILLRRLALFAGGWNLEAAEAICAGEEIEIGMVLNLLSSLIDKSLVIFEQQEPEGGGRYRLLEMVRQYATAKMPVCGETEKIKSRHRDWFLALAEKTKTTGSEAARSLACLEREYDNMRAALTWCREDTQGNEAGLRLGGALWRFWYLHGHYGEGRAFLEEALGRDGAQAKTRVRAQALEGAGVLATSQGDHTAAQIFLAESLSIYQDLEDRRGIAVASANLGNVFYRTGEYQAARALYEESLRLYRELEDQLGVGRSLYNLGNVAFIQGDYTAAKALFEESLSIRRELGDKTGSAIVSNRLGNLAVQQGDYAAARALFVENLNIRRSLGDRQGIAVTLGYLGGVAFEQGEYTEAQTLYEESLSVCQKLGDRAGVARALNSLGHAAYGRSEHRSAQALCEESLCLYRELGAKSGVAHSLCNLSELAYDRGAYVEARTLAEESLRIRQTLGDKRGVADSLETLALVMSAPKDIRQAVRLWGTAHQLRKTLGTPMPHMMRQKYDRWVEQARFILGEVAYDTAWKEGNVLPWDQVSASPLPPL